jgi:hypothetical protein
MTIEAPRPGAPPSCVSMAELELTRSRDDRRLYEVDGVGALRLGRFFSRRATAEAGAATWLFDRRGLWRGTTEASDMTGAVVGSFAPRRLRRGGVLRWRGRDFELRPAATWKERYALLDGQRELAALTGKGWGKRPVKITLADPGAVEPGLLLFAAYVVRGLAEDASAAAAAAT